MDTSGGGRKGYRGGGPFTGPGRSAGGHANAALRTPQKIDRPTYERQRDLLRETVALATIEVQDATLDEIDVEGVLGFAEHVLANATRLWADATLELKQRLQRVLFPEGLRLKAGRLGTAATCLAFMQLRPFDGRQEGLASPTGFEPVF